MEKKKYDYNYDFLREYMAKHNIINSDVLEVLGNRNYAMLKAWREQQRPMSIESMLKICNHYDIPVSRFFIVDESAHAMNDDEEEIEARILQVRIECQKKLDDIIQKYQQEMQDMNLRHLAIIENQANIIRELTTKREGNEVKRNT